MLGTSFDPNNSKSGNIYRGHFLIILFKMGMIGAKEQFCSHCLDEHRCAVAKSMEGELFHRRSLSFAMIGI